jgi:hypothetical protein
MARVLLEAHCIEDEFEASILANHGVRIGSREGEPWDVEFIGPREGPRKMYEEHWGDCGSDRDIDEMIED